MKRAKIEAKLVKIFKQALPKNMRKGIDYVTFVQNDSFRENQDVFGPTPGTIILSLNTVGKVIHNIADTFNLPKIKNNPQEVGRDLMNGDYMISDVVTYVKEMQDTLKPFEHEDTTGNLCIIGKDMVQLDRHDFTADSTFWQAFDVWYKDNRKRLFTKPKKEKPVKQIKPKKAKKNKTKQTEAAAPVLQ